MKRLWGIRHLRWLVHSWRLHRWAAQWGRAGVGLGVPHASDLMWLEMIRKGEA